MSEIIMNIRLYHYFYIQTVQTTSFKEKLYKNYFCLIESGQSVIEIRIK